MRRHRRHRQPQGLWLEAHRDTRKIPRARNSDSIPGRLFGGSPTECIQCLLIKQPLQCAPIDIGRQTGHTNNTRIRAGAAVQVGWEAKAYICPLEAHVEQHIVHVISMRPTAELYRRC